MRYVARLHGLAARAARLGLTIQKYLCRRLTEPARRRDAAALARRIAERKRHTGTPMTAAEIIEHRDAGRQ